MIEGLHDDPVPGMADHQAAVGQDPAVGHVSADVDRSAMGPSADSSCSAERVRQHPEGPAHRLQADQWRPGRPARWPGSPAWGLELRVTRTHGGPGLLKASGRRRASPRTAARHSCGGWTSLPAGRRNRVGAWRTSVAFRVRGRSQCRAIQAPGTEKSGDPWRVLRSP